MMSEEPESSDLPPRSITPEQRVDALREVNRGGGRLAFLWEWIKICSVSLLLFVVIRSPRNARAASNKPAGRLVADLVVAVSDIRGSCEGSAGFGVTAAGHDNHNSEHAKSNPQTSEDYDRTHHEMVRHYAPAERPPVERVRPDSRVRFVKW